jgi:hypothetical protein
MARRGISEDTVRQVLAEPEQVVAGHGGKQVHQATMAIEGRTFLVRVVVATDTDPATVVPVYRTTKIERYRR